ncbi:MAG: ornithine carbamoyltransferase [Thermaurantiacus sp.]
MPHFLSLSDAGPAGLRTMLEAAHARKASRGRRPKGAPDDDAPLSGHVLASVFEKPSTRTRISFEIAMQQLGGTALTLTAGDLQLGRGETIEDTARVLSGFVDVAMIRARAHGDLETFAGAASVPLINGLTDRSHPCQVVADLMTVEERLGRPVAGTRWAWLGDGNNVANSLIEAAGLLGFAIRLGVPRGYEPDAGFVAAAVARGGSVEIVHDALDAAGDADVVVTDTWISMGQEGGATKLAAMRPFQVGPMLMACAAPHAIFLHCLPAHRGEEVTDNVLDGPQSAAWQEAENRVHAQKAVLLWALGRL